jgi:hypothetical protein
MRVVVLILGCALGIAAFASDGGKVSLGDVAESAVRQSKLTLPGSKSFHLKAEIVETTNPSSEYQAKIEEYWISPEKWRRTIESPGFSQTLIVNGDEVSEKNTGDYFPWWLNNLVTAMMDPLPMVEQLKQIDSQIAKPRGSENSNTCADLRTKIDRWIFCFEGSHGLLTSVFVRGYSAEFKDFKGFGDKRVARLIVIDPEPGTTIQARITELTEFRQAEENLFAVPQRTPAQERINTVKVDEATVRGLALKGTEIIWPPVGGGLTTGRCAVYVSADRTGRMREVWPQGCDNPGLQDPLREMVKKWQLKPAAENGAAVQIQALVTFMFDTKLVKGDPIPILTVADMARQTISCKPSSISPGLLPKGTVVTVRVSVNETGDTVGVSPVGRCPVGCGLLAGPIVSINKCKFAPYTVNGRATNYQGDLELVAP